MAQQTRQLKVNFSGSTLRVTGAKSGRLYVYVPERDRGLLEVEERDVPDLLKMQYSSGDREDQKRPYFSL